MNLVKSNNNGFTITELIIVIVVLGILFAIALPNYIKAKDKARESEVKSNIHRILIALERYGNDFQHYPAMIWGGDRKGWSTAKGVGCRTMWEHEEYDPEKDNNATARPPFDPLIYYGYLESYPRNPFMKKNEGLTTTIKWTGPQNAKFGDGDPRFGFNGEIMGNIIEDPRYLWYQDKNKKLKLSRIQNCFLDEAEENHVAMTHPYLPFNPFYSMGGIPDWRGPLFDYPGDVTISTIIKDVQLMRAWWPGEFLYRSHGSFKFPDDFDDSKKDKSGLGKKWDLKIWDFQYETIDSFVLCGFGSMRTDGQDFIRLTDMDGAAINNMTGYQNGGNYEPHPDYPFTQESLIRFSSPEVFGGGKPGKMPYFPYIDPETGDWLYGAPDGFRDGIIIVITSSGIGKSLNF